MATPTPVPAMPAPKDEVSDFSHPDSLLRWDIVAVAVCLSITTILFLLRVYVRGFIKREWVFDDCKSSGSSCLGAHADELLDVVCLAWVSQSAILSTFEDGHPY